MQESHGFVGVEGGGLMQDQADNCPQFPRQTNLPQVGYQRLTISGADLFISSCCPREIEIDKSSIDIN